MYLKNTSAETVKEVMFWLSADSPYPDTTYKFAKDAAGKNGTAQTIANINTAPTSVVWHGQTARFTPTPNIGTLATTDYFPLWVWRHVAAVAASAEGFERKDDGCIFSGDFQIAATGTGDTGGGGSGGGGGGTGGNPPPTPSDWKIAVIGDEGCGSITDAVHDAVQDYDFIISVGDHAYTSAGCWTSTWDDLKPKMVSAFGNHEYSESGGIGPYKTFFGISKTYYSKKFQNVFVILIDSNIDMDVGSAQHDFVTAELAKADVDPDVDWIFCVMHHPWFGASSKHSYNDGSAVQNFHAEFMTHAVAFVFTGHNHTWQCSKQVSYNAGSPTNPTVFDAATPFVKTTSGLIHVISGTSGHDSAPDGKLYALGAQPSFQLYQNRTNNGYFELAASNNGQTLTCAFINTNGDRFNEFVITTA